MPFIGDLPPDHEIFAGRAAASSGDDYLQGQVEEGLDSPLRVDSPEPEDESSDGGENESEINALAGMLNEGEENGEEEAPASPKRRNRVPKDPASTKKTPKSAAKALGGRGRPRGGGVSKPIKTPTKAARSSARVHEIAKKPAPKVEAAAPAKNAAGTKRGRPAGGVGSGRPAKKAKTNEPEYEVEKIVDSHVDEDSLQHHYEVKWKGYNSSENTWEPKENLTGCIDLIRAFDMKHKTVQTKQLAEAKKKAKEENAAARAKYKENREAEKAKKAAEPKVPGKRGRKPKASRRTRGRPQKA
ncbi:hypothetical protein MKZ38_000573 [Zalerion maritima]|uniref:Chromo domain-containing protein n=1 Tax=Zalerion maritima TaxID=339359 RepID=A0AAD5WSG7_9PEZI|nr:hypothetical protein MKZ38_000573 [Zalerion maritima]